MGKCPAAGFSSEEESGDLSRQKMRPSSEKEATTAPSSATALALKAGHSQSRTMPRDKKKRELVQIRTKRPAGTTSQSSRKKARSWSSSSLRHQCPLWNPSEHSGHSSSSSVVVDEPRHIPSSPPQDQTRAPTLGGETGTIRMLDGPSELSERNLRAHTESVGRLGYDPMERLGMAGANNRSQSIHHHQSPGDSGMRPVAVASPGSDFFPARTILPLRETAKADTPIASTGSMESPSSLRPLRLPDLSLKDGAPGKETTKRCLFPTSSSSHVVECVDGEVLEATTTGVTDAVAVEAVMLPQQKEQWNHQDEPEILPAVSTRVVPRSISAVAGADALNGLVVVCDETQAGSLSDPAKKKEAPIDKTVADFFRQRLAGGDGRPSRDDGDDHNNAGPSSLTVASFLRHRLPSPPSKNGLISQGGPTKSNQTILPIEGETFQPSSNPSMADGEEDTPGDVRAFAPTKRVAPSKKKKKKSTPPAVISTRTARTLLEAPLPRRRGTTQNTETSNTTSGMAAIPVSPEPMIPAVRTVGRRPSNNHRVSLSMMVFAAWSMLTWQTAVPPTTTMTGGLGKTSFHPALTWKNAARIDQGPSHDALKASTGMTEN